MKRTTAFIALAFLATLIVSCSLDRDNPTEPSGPNPTPGLTTIPVGATRTFQPSGLEITFDTVLFDNRCPRDVYCFASGMAVIKLYVASSPSDRQALIFHIDPFRPAPDTSRYVVTDAGRFRINLRSLDPYPSVPEPHDYEDNRITLTVRPFEANKLVIGAVVPSRLAEPTLRGENIAINSVRVDRSKLEMTVTYGGGCHNHNYTLFMHPIVFAESAPVQANLYLHHFGDGDPCRALITEELSFDLQPMLDLHMQYYGRDDEILLNVYHQPDSVWELKEQVLYEPPRYQTSMLPMAIGNFWVYADTAWRDGVPEGSIDTVEVIGRTIDSLGVWWHLSNPLLTLGDKIMVKGDSIYSPQDCWGRPCFAREYIPAVDTPFTYGYVIWGDIYKTRRVSRVDTSVTVPAGTFDGLYRYEDYIYCADDYEQRLFKPSVGFIYRYVPCIYSSTEVITRRAWLIEYHLEN